MYFSLWPTQSVRKGSGVFRSLIISLLSLIIILSLAGFVRADASVVINEIHYDPDVATELVEFIELHNFGSTDVNLSGWYFSDGISYRFPAGSIIPAGGYVIVAQNPAHINTKWNSGRFFISQDSIFGPFEFASKLDSGGEKVELCNAEGRVIDKVDYQLGFPWPTVGDAVPEDQPGMGSSIQLVNPLFDNDLGGSWRSAYPTPAEQNSFVYAENIPPHIRQVKHLPKQPKSDEIVTVTAKVTDSDGVAEVSLVYQIVEPGNYININDRQYPSNWTSIAMNDDGLNGDEAAGDDIYTVQMPGSLQIHRRLIRYRIVVVDNRVYAGSIGNLLNKYQGTFYCFDADDSQTPTIIGPYSGLAGVEYEYELVTIDPNGNDIYYGIDWGDNSGHEWIGPYPSGEEVTVKHTWNKHGNYIIKTKAKDIYGHESDWGTLEVSMPKNTQTQVFTLNESLDTNQYFVFLKGKCDSMGIGGRVIHIGPFWYCKNFGVVSYTMEKNSILIVNGNKQEVNFPAFIAFYRFKGYGPFVPIFIYKAITQGKIRVIGVCDEISISPV